MDDFTTHWVYRIVCFFTCKVYVGQTRNLGIRQRTHFRLLQNGNHHNRRLQADYNLYGASQFYFEVLETDIPLSTIDNREKYWIAHFDSCSNGYNATIGGSRLSQPKRRLPVVRRVRQKRWTILDDNKPIPTTDELNGLVIALGISKEQCEEKHRILNWYDPNLEYCINKEGRLVPRKSSITP